MWICFLWQCTRGANAATRCSNKIDIYIIYMEWYRALKTMVPVFRLQTFFQCDIFLPPKPSKLSHSPADLILAQFDLFPLLQTLCWFQDLLGAYLICDRVDVFHLYLEWLTQTIFSNSMKRVIISSNSSPPCLFCVKVNHNSVSKVPFSNSFILCYHLIAIIILCIKRFHLLHWSDTVSATLQYMSLTSTYWPLLIVYLCVT